MCFCTQHPIPKEANGPIAGFVISYERIKSGDVILSENGLASQRVVSRQHQAYRLDQLKPWSTYKVKIASFNLLSGERLYSKSNEELTIDTEVDSKEILLSLTL